MERPSLEDLSRVATEIPKGCGSGSERGTEHWESQGESGHSKERKWRVESEDMDCEGF